MKCRNILVAVSLALVALLLVSGPAHAQNNPLITVDENGNGSLLFPGGSPIPTAGALIADPGPGGLSSALTYNLLGPPSLVAGDVLLVEPGGGTSDLIRFNPAGTGGGGYPASLVFYSDALSGGTAKADTGFPTAQYTNVVTLTEFSSAGKIGFFGYTPTADQPGFVAGFGVTYNFISDVTAPEPASITLTALGGLLGLAFVVRKRARKTTA